jgi:TatD DNase family protein
MGMSANPPELVDSHLHLQDPALRPCIEGVLDRARAAGVRWMVCNATHPGDWQAVTDLAGAHEGILPCLGLHPWFVGQADAGWDDELADRLAALPAGVGEIGLDRWVEPRDEQAQERAFRRQLEIAADLDRPVMIHCLRAWGWLRDVLTDVGSPPAGMLIHAYGGSAEMLRELADRGAVFSFAGNVLHDRKHKLRDVLAQVPSHRLLIETDAPDMPPPDELCTGPLRDDDGSPVNEPSHLAGIARHVAGVRDRSTDELARQLLDNARRFFAPIWPGGDQETAE